MTRAPGRTRLATWDAREVVDRLDELVAVYKAAFLDVWEADPDHAARERRLHMRGHLDRPETRVVTALDDDGTIVGFAYGSPGLHGGWWHDTVSSRLRPDERLRWLSDSLEIVELHVMPDWQGQGLGRALLRLLLQGSQHSTAALSALNDPELPARKLYAAEGFHLLRSDFHFPGTSTPYAILVVGLPLPNS